VFKTILSRNVILSLSKDEPSLHVALRQAQRDALVNTAFHTRSIIPSLSMNVILSLSKDDTSLYDV